MSQNKISTKQAIISSSKKLFSQRGYRATTVRDIAKEADVAISAIAYHFNNKEGILVNIITSIGAEIGPELFAPLDVAVNSAEELEIRLKIFINNIIIVGIKNWETVKILLTESYELSKFESANSLSQHSMHQLSIFLKNAKKSKVIKSKTSELLLADHIMALVMDQVLHWKTKKEIEGLDFSDKVQREKWVNATIELLFHGAVI